MAPICRTPRVPLLLLVLLVAAYGPTLQHPLQVSAQPDEYEDYAAWGFSDINETYYGAVGLGSDDLFPGSDDAYWSYLQGDSHSDELYGDANNDDAGEAAGLEEEDWYVESNVPGQGGDAGRMEAAGGPDFAGPSEPPHPLFVWDNCVEGPDGEAQLNGTHTCDLVINGVDARTGLLPDGVDGVYELTGCYQGKAFYMRRQNSGAQYRCLYYSPNFGDWELALADSLETVMAQGSVDVIMYSSYGQLSPLDVSLWHVTADWDSQHADQVQHTSHRTGPRFITVKSAISVQCDGLPNAETEAKGGVALEAPTDSSSNPAANVAEPKAKAAKAGPALDEVVALIKRGVTEQDVPPSRMLEAILALEKLKWKPEGDTLLRPLTTGHWRLTFLVGAKDVLAAEKGERGGKGYYVPIIVAANKYSAEDDSFENGLFFGPLGHLTFKGPFRLLKKVGRFTVTRLYLGLGPWRLEFPLGKDPTTPDMSASDATKALPAFFVYAYVDDDLLVARGRSGGLACWRRSPPEEAARSGTLQVFKR